VVSRVLRLGGRLLIYTMRATDLLSARETVLMLENLGVVTRRMLHRGLLQESRVEDRALRSAGFRVGGSISGNTWANPANGCCVWPSCFASLTTHRALRLPEL
jgi:hypothetical protein